jgi:hypothetical protein
MRTALAAIGVAFISQSQVSPPLIVHEWGTITTQHETNGTPRGRLNRIAASDTLPTFVHTFEPSATRADPTSATVKSVLIPGRPDVTMRLETPVLYFYRPAGWSPSQSFDVGVRFRGGILNEFYPDANAKVAVDSQRVRAKLAAGAIGGWNGAVLDNFVVSDLRWTRLSLRDNVPLQTTSSHVWLAPRRVRSSGVMTAGNEGERYLFYRGVAHLDALFQTAHTENELRLLVPYPLLWLSADSARIPATWLLDVSSDRRLAFRSLGPITLSRRETGAELARVTFPTTRSAAAGDQLAALRRDVKDALIRAGLFEDEAEAMLETWNESYFRAPGRRLLYIVPREWIDYFLPLEISVPSKITRVLVGRIDLLDP